MNISLILATLGRKNEIIQLFNSLLVTVNYVENSKVQIIVVDQNPVEFGLKEIVLNYSTSLDIKYIHSSVKGLSHNRNIGLKYVTGDYICFPDDDCTYYESTLLAVLEAFKNDAKADVVLGRIYDRQLCRDIIKKWPLNVCQINKLNVYFLASSITMFIKFESGMRFDESLGVGAIYGSCEDPDFLYRLLHQGKKIIYTPTIEVWHPVPDATIISLEKVNSYASGFGAFIRKDFDLVKLYLLLGCLGKKSYQLIFAKNKFKKGYFNAFFKGIFNGFTKFKSYENK